MVGASDWVASAWFRASHCRAWRRYILELRHTLVPLDRVKWNAPQEYASTFPFARAYQVFLLSCSSLTISGDTATSSTQAIPTCRHTSMLLVVPSVALDILRYSVSGHTSQELASKARRIPAAQCLSHTLHLSRLLLTSGNVKVECCAHGDASVQGAEETCFWPEVMDTCRGDVGRILLRVGNAKQMAPVLRRCGWCGCLDAPVCQPCSAEEYQTCHPVVVYGMKEPVVEISTDVPQAVGPQAVARCL